MKLTPREEVIKEMAMEESELPIREQRSIAWRNLRNTVNELIELRHSPGIPGIGFNEGEHERLVEEGGKANTFLKQTQGQG